MPRIAALWLKRNNQWQTKPWLEPRSDISHHREKQQNIGIDKQLSGESQPGSIEAAASPASCSVAAIMPGNGVSAYGWQRKPATASLAAGSYGSRSLQLRIPAANGSRSVCAGGQQPSAAKAVPYQPGENEKWHRGMGSGGAAWHGSGGGGGVSRMVCQSS